MRFSSGIGADTSAPLRQRCRFGLDCMCADLARLGWPPRFRALPIGETLIHSGLPCRSLHLLQSGAMKSSSDSREGEMQVVAFHFPGELAGLVMPERGAVHHADATALEESVVCELPGWSWHWAPGAAPLLHARLGALWNLQSAYLQSHVEMMGRAHAMQKVALFLLEMRNRAGSAAEPDLAPLPMSRRDIANYLGVAVETACRRLGELRQDGVIAPDRRGVRLRRVNRLAALASDTPSGSAGTEAA